MVACSISCKKDQNTCTLYYSLGIVIARINKTCCRITELSLKSSSNTYQNNCTLLLIKLPPKMRKRHRSKGLANTVIGLPRKKAKGAPVAFEKLLAQQRDKIILLWFVGMDVAEAAMKGKVITEDIVETIPENVNNACIDECIWMQNVKRFFTDDAWKIVEAILMIEQEGAYLCEKDELTAAESWNVQPTTYCSFSGNLLYPKEATTDMHAESNLSAINRYNLGA